MKLFGKRTDKTQMVTWNTATTSVMNDSSVHASITFSTPWTVRTMTPIRRVPSGKLWSQTARYVPPTYGGPQ